MPNSEKKYQLLAKCARKFCHLSCTVFVDLFQLHNHILFANSCFITTIWQAASNTFSLQLLIYDTPNGNSQWWTVACRQTFLTVFGNMLIYVTFDYHNNFHKAVRWCLHENKVFLRWANKPTDIELFFAF